MENIWIRNIGKKARVWYRDDEDRIREKDGVIADADFEFIVILKDLNNNIIKISSITRSEINNEVVG